MTEWPGKVLWGDEQLEDALRDLGRDEHFPSTPDIAAAVGASLREERPRRAPGPFRPSPRRLAVAAAIALLLAGVAVVAIPDTRDGVADWLGIRSVAIVESTATPADIPQGASLELGELVTFDEASRRATYQLLIPDDESLGAPDAVYFNPRLPGGQVSYVYQAREDLPEGEIPGIGLLITQFRAGDPRPSAGKGSTPWTTLNELEIDGWPALWIEGAPHTFFYVDGSGYRDHDTLRLAGNVLLWERDGVLVRIEANLSRNDVISIAESMHQLEDDE